jgi:hypothetical protein
MSDMSLEAPDADAAEQDTEALPADNGELGDRPEPPLEANEADSDEQAQAVSVDDDEYR